MNMPAGLENTSSSSLTGIPVNVKYKLVHIIIMLLH